MTEYHSVPIPLEYNETNKLPRDLNPFDFDIYKEFVEYYCALFFEDGPSLVYIYILFNILRNIHVDCSVPTKVQNGAKH